MDLRETRMRSWLAHVLNDQTLHITVASSDASFRRYFRVTKNQQSFIVMDAPPELEDSKPFIRVRDLLQKAGVSVPEILRADLDEGFLLLTDFGEQHFLGALKHENVQRLYADALDALLTMQRHADSTTLAPYNETLLMFEMSLFGDWFLGRHLGAHLSESATAVLDETCRFLCGSALEQPQVFVHRDYHSRNLMLIPEGNPGIIDFQDAVRGPITYDLVSLLRDVYVKWPEERVNAWLEEYYDRLKHYKLVQLTLEDFTRRFDLMGVQRHLKVAGIFCRLYYRDGKAGYLPDIPLTLDYLTTVCARLEELSALHTLLLDLEVVTALEERNSGVIGAGASANASAIE